MTLKNTYTKTQYLTDNGFRKTKKHQKSVISLTKLRPTMRLFYMYLSITAQPTTLELLKRTCTQKVKTRFSGHTWKLKSGLAAKEATY